jgi:hypothetical protein
MLASRLCLAAGILDVEKWLTGEDAKRILDWWEAYDRVEPLPEPWLQTAVVCHELAKTQATIMASQGAKIKETDIRTWQSFMPPRWRPPPKKKRPARTLEQEAEVCKRWAIQ